MVTGKVLGGDSIVYTLETTATQFSGVGEYPITVSLGANPNYAVSATDSTLTIDAAPIEVRIHAPNSGLVQSIDAPVEFLGSFTLSGNPGVYSARWIVSSATVAETIIEATLTETLVADAIQFPDPGIYAIRLEVDDGMGITGETDLVENELPAYVVIYDPNGGFVTGGGWIWSPAGALHPELAEFAGVTGKASFGFVAKYQKGAMVPSGNTQFQFRAGDLNFKSAAYDWLVVAGARAQYKGWGTVNGWGEYGFMLTAIDGQVNGPDQPDRFRMKIWDTASGLVIYDNQAGTADDAQLETATVIGGGSVVIHTSR